MLQNVVSGAPNLAKVLNLYCQPRKQQVNPSRSLSENASSFLPNKPKFMTTRRAVQFAIVVEVLLLIISSVHDFDDEGDEEPQLDDIWEANAMNQQDPKTGCCLGNKSCNKST